MAQKVTIALQDDLDGGPADETIRFAIDGNGYEIDLRTSHADAFRTQLAPYIQHARRAGRSQPRQPGRAADSRQHTGDIRAWAKDHGIVVSQRGRISASVAEQYRAAHNGR
jgi:Lsr2